MYHSCGKINNKKEKIMNVLIWLVLCVFAGILPNLVGGWNALDSWQWWAIAMPIDVLAFYIFISNNKKTR
jgi:hypothetical protein